MSFNTTLPFGNDLSKNVNNELWIASAFDAPAGAYLQISGHSDIPHTAGGMQLHPDHDFIFESNSCMGLRGDFTIEYTWIEDQTVTQEMLDTFVNVVNDTNIGSNVVFEYTQVDFIARTATFRLSVPPAPELGWRGSPLDWGILLQNQKVIWDSIGYYLCYLIIDEDWRNWTTKARDIAPNSSLVIDRIEGAATVYLIFSEDVTTSTGVTLNRGVAYSQTSESMEVTTGNADTLVIRASR
jgi:hypothetical protein